MFDFPATPTEGQIYSPASGPTYVYNAPAWKIAPATLAYLPLTGGTLSGDLEISKTDPVVRLRATTGNGAYIEAMKNGLTRWSMRMVSHISESGASAGSDWLLDRFNDAGTFIDTVFQIARATGAALFRGSVEINRAEPNFTLNKTASGQGANLWGSLNGLARWQIVLGSNAAESSGNVGSEFHIHQYTDAGAYLATALSIGRALSNISGNAIATAAEYLANSINKWVTTNGLWAAAAQVTITYAASMTLNGGTFINAVISPTGGLTLNNTTGFKQGQSGFIRILGNGAHALAFGNLWWFPAGNKPTTMSGGQDIIYYQCVDGSSLFCTYIRGITNV